MKNLLDKLSKPTIVTHFEKMFIYLSFALVWLQFALI